MTEKERLQRATRLVKMDGTGTQAAPPMPTARESLMKATKLVKADKPQRSISAGASGYMPTAAQVLKAAQLRNEAARRQTEDRKRKAEQPQAKSGAGASGVSAQRKMTVAPFSNGGGQAAVRALGGVRTDGRVTKGVRPDLLGAVRTQQDDKDWETLTRKGSYYQTAQDWKAQLAETEKTLTQAEQQLTEAQWARNMEGTAPEGGAEWESAEDKARREEANRQANYAQARVTHLRAQKQQLEKDINTVLWSGRTRAAQEDASFDALAAKGAARRRQTVKERKEKLDAAADGTGPTWGAMPITEQAQNGIDGGTEFDYLTAEELKFYDYFVGKGDDAAAKEYLEQLHETVNQRLGEAQAKKIRDEETPVLRGVATAMYGVGAGINNAGAGMQQMFSSERVPTSPMAFGSEYIREDLADTGPKIFGQSLGQIGYGAAELTGGLAPRVALGAVNPALGVAVGSASTYGNTYNQALSQGYDKGQARSYAMVRAAMDGALQYAMGGISKLGGGATGKLASRAVENIDHAALRVAADVGIHGMAQGTRDYLLAALDPAMRNWLLDEDNDVNLISEEAAYAFLTGFFTAGVMRIPGAMKAELNRPGKALAARKFDEKMPNYRAKDGTDYFDGVEDEAGAKARYRQLARENHPDMGGDSSVMQEINRQYEMRLAYYKGSAQAQRAAPWQEPQTEGKSARENTTTQQTQKTAPGEGAGGLTPVSPEMQASLSTGKNNFIAKTASDIVAFAKRVLQKKGGPERLYMGTLPQATAQFVQEQTGVDVDGYQAILPGDSVQHIFNHHGDAAVENARGQRAVSSEDIGLIGQVLAAPDSVTREETTDVLGRTVLLFSKKIGDTYVTAQAVTDERHALTTASLWIKKGKPTDTTHNTDVTISPVSNAQSAPPSGFPVGSIPQTLGGVNRKQAGVLPTVKDTILYGRENGVSFDVARRILEARAMGQEIAPRPEGAVRGLLPVGESTVIDTNPATHTPEQQAVIEAYQAAVDPELTRFYEAAKNGEAVQPYRLKPVDERAAKRIKEITGKDVGGFSLIIEPRIAKHINKDHGAEGHSDHSMADANDVGRIQYVVDNFDDIVDGGTTDAYWEPKENGKNRRARTVVFSKKVNGTYFLVEAVPDTKAKSAYVVSAYMRKTGAPRLTDAKAPVFTAKTDNAETPVSRGSIPQTPGKVKVETGLGEILGVQENVTVEKPTEAELEMLRQAKEGREEREGTGYQGTPATNKLGIKISHPITGLGISKSLREAGQAKYEADQALDKVLRDTHADERARRIAKGIAEGVYTLRDAERMGLNTKAIREIAEKYWVRDSFGDQLKRQKERTNWRFDGVVQMLIKNSDRATPPSVLSLNLNTMQRNTERTWGSAAKAINEEIFDPVVENEAERIRFVNEMMGRIEQFHLDEKESAAVQMLMEKKVSVEQLKAKGMEGERLQAAADTLTGLYNEFYEAINDFLVAHGYPEIGFQKNYAPHMQEENIGKLQKFLRRLGFAVEVTELPTDLAGRTDTFRPGKQFNPFFQHRVGDKVIYDAVGGFESYVNYLSNVLYHTDDIQKMRRFSEAIRVKEGSEELGAEIDRLNQLEHRLTADDLLTEEDVQAGKEAAYERLSKGRKGHLGGYVSVLDDYTNILAGKQTKMDRAFETMFGRGTLNIGKAIQNRFAASAVMGNLSSAVNQTVQLPQLVAEVGPRNVLGAINEIMSGRLKALGFIQESDFLTGKVGTKSISEKTRKEKVFDLASRPFEVVDDFASQIIVRAKYLEQVQKGKKHAEALKEADRYAARLVGSRMKGAKPVFFEQKNLVSKLISTFQLEVMNGWEHIKYDLPKEVRETPYTLEKGNRYAASRRAVELAVASMICSFVANLIIKQITGQEPVPYDALGMAANFMAEGYGMTKEDYMAAVADDAAEKLTGNRPLGAADRRGKFSLQEATEALGEDVMEDVPLLSNATTMLGITDGRLPLPQVWNKKMKTGVDKLWTVREEEDEKERRQTLNEGLLNLLEGAVTSGLSWLPGGNQIKKSAQGITTMARGGVYSGYGDNAQLQYSVGRDPANIVRGALFGKSALPETDEYYAERAKMLTVGQTQVYEELKKSGMDGPDAYDLIQKLRTVKKTDTGSEVEERIRELERSGVEDSTKVIVYRGMLASDREKELFGEMEKAGAEMEKVYHTLVNIRRATTAEGKEDSNKKRKAIQTSGLTDEQKIILYRAKITDDRDDDIQAAQEAGLPFDQFLEAQSVYTSLNKNESLSKKAKRTEFKQWMHTQVMTAKQEMVLGEAFKFYTQVPVGETTYEKLYNAGWSSGEAGQLAEKIDALEPLDGKDAVSSLQKCRVIVDNGGEIKMQMAALETVMTDTEYMKLASAYDTAKVSPKVWVCFREHTKEISNQKQVEKYLDNLLLPKEAKAALWQMKNTGWKPQNNPYDKEVSRRVYAAYKMRAGE